MFPLHVIRCRPIHGTCRSLWARHQPVGIVSVLLAVLVGCSALQPRLEGLSGPIAWQATDLRVIERKVAGDNRDLYAFTLVLKELQNTTITFTQMEYRVSQPGVKEFGVTQQKALAWTLKPHGELRKPFAVYWYCSSGHCDDFALYPAPQYDIVLTGSNDKGDPIRAAVHFKLPPNPPRLTHGQDATRSRPVSPAPVATPQTERGGIPIQVVKNTIWVHALLNDQDDVRLLLDTGAAVTVLTPEAATRLRISPPADAPEHTVRIAGGQKVGFAYTQLDALRVGPSVVEAQKVGVARVLPEAPLVDGILGGDVLRQFTVVLNYAASRLHLWPLGTPQPLPSSHPVSVGVTRNLPWVRAKLNDRETVTLLLDTGSTLTLLHPETAQRVGMSLAADAPQRTLSVFGGQKITTGPARFSRGWGSGGESSASRGV